MDINKVVFENESDRLWNGFLSLISRLSKWIRFMDIVDVASFLKIKENMEMYK